MPNLESSQRAQQILCWTQETLTTSKRLKPSKLAPSKHTVTTVHFSLISSVDTKNALTFDCGDFSGAVKAYDGLFALKNRTAEQLMAGGMVSYDRGKIS